MQPCCFTTFQDLSQEFKDELGGAFGQVVSGLMMDPEEYLVEQVKAAIKVKRASDSLFTAHNFFCSISICVYREEKFQFAVVTVDHFCIFYRAEIFF